MNADKLPMTASSSTTPRVSLLLLAFNQEGTVRRAAESVLAQLCEPLEIVLSDDASSDGTFAILQELASAYRGVHRVRARRNEKNVGIGEHYNRLLACSSGRLLVTAAGDDFSVPHRVQSLIRAWDASGGRADLIASHVIDLDHDDRLHDVIRVDDLASYTSVEQWAKKRPYIIGAGHAFTRRMMERFGPMLPDVFYEDQIMTFRAIVGGGAVTVDEALVHYRRGGTSRKPNQFDSTEHMAWWTYRQRTRELAEMDQLIQDSRVVGCDGLLRGMFEARLKKEQYLRQLDSLQTNRDRWRAFHRAAPLPRWWRLRKMLHVMLPQTTGVVKRALSVFHHKH
jgi:glycosyltransferase involved in cell wall biosynthesis